MSGCTRREFVERTVTVAGTAWLTSVVGPLEAPRAAAGPLPTRPFGRTGVEVTLVGLGGGSRFYEPVDSDEAGAEIVRRAIEAGVGVVETSANYGRSGESERRIGLAMHTHRARVFLETKVDARDYDGAMREIERSLARLQTDHIDLMLHHYVRTRDELAHLAGPSGAERAIRKLAGEKVIRFRGVSCHDPALTLDLIERLEPEAIQVPVNATGVPDFESRVLPLALEKGIAVVAMKTCGHGYFFKTNPTRPDRIDRYGPPAEALAGADLPTPRDYLHYALSLPVATAVVGMDSCATVDGVVESARAFTPMSEPQRAALRARVQGFRTTGYWLDGVS
jgi:aryl-alcohol dehydrogenase-like predicted oxidoreductase